MTQHITVGGAPEGFDARLILDEVEKSGGPVLHVARDDKRLASLQAALAFFRPICRCCIFPVGTVCLMIGCRPMPIFGGAHATLAGLVHGMRRNSCS